MKSTAFLASLLKIEIPIARGSAPFGLRARVGLIEDERAFSSRAFACAVDSALPRNRIRTSRGQINRIR